MEGSNTTPSTNDRRPGGDADPSGDALEGARAFYARRPPMPIEVELATKRLQLQEGGLLTRILDEAVAATGMELGTVVDFGGRSGANLQLLADRQRIQRRVCFDFTPPATPLSGIEYVSGAWTELAARVPPHSVDLILAVEVIEHVYDPDAMLAFCRRLLRPGGVLLLTTPNLSSLVSRLSLLLGWQPLDTEVSTVTRFGFPGATRWSVVGHIRVFTFRALLEFLRFHDWRIERAYTVAQGRTAPTGGRLSGALGFYARLDRFAGHFGRRLASHSIAVVRPNDPPPVREGTGPVVSADPRERTPPSPTGE